MTTRTWTTGGAGEQVQEAIQEAFGLGDAEIDDGEGAAGDAAENAPADAAAASSTSAPVAD